MMLNENKSKKSKVLNKTEISKIIKSKFKNNKLKDFFHDIEMFNDIQSLAKDSNIDLDLCLYGINVGIPVIKEFLSFREDMDFEKINEITITSSDCLSKPGGHHINDLYFLDGMLYFSYFSKMGKWKMGLLDGGLSYIDSHQDNI